ncbi:hypothetical protein [Streptacidiphilus sp. EB129]|uniref:hypothetical protein n=1 Tax=Streptacidiphilus sp. EB129 TaxID=3156262 RepID=UPI0035192D1E
MVIRTLDAFTVRFEFRVRETTWTVHAKGERAPVARVHRPDGPSSRRPYRVYSGPQLDTEIGLLAGGTAFAPDRTRIGGVVRDRVEGVRGQLLQNEVWTFSQVGFGDLAGNPVGLGSRARHTLLDDYMDNSVADALLDHRLRYRSDDSSGFELIRRSGMRSRYDVRIHDPRVNRILVLAAVGCFDDLYGDADMRKLGPMVAGLFRR